MFEQPNFKGKVREFSRAGGFAIGIGVRSFIIPEVWDVNLYASTERGFSCVIKYDDALWGDRIDDTALCFDTWVYQGKTQTFRRSFDGLLRIHLTCKDAYPDKQIIHEDRMVWFRHMLMTTAVLILICVLVARKRKHCRTPKQSKESLNCQGSTNSNKT